MSTARWSTVTPPDRDLADPAQVVVAKVVVIGRPRSNIPASRAVRQRMGRDCPGRSRRTGQRGVVDFDLESIAHGVQDPQKHGRIGRAAPQCDHLDGRDGVEPSIVGPQPPVLDGDYLKEVPFDGLADEGGHEGFGPPVSLPRPIIGEVVWRHPFIQGYVRRGLLRRHAELFGHVAGMKQRPQFPLARRRPRWFE